MADDYSAEDFRSAEGETFELDAEDQKGSTYEAVFN